MTKQEYTKIAENIMQIRALGKNSPTQDGQNQAESACDCIAYAIAYDVLKDEKREDFMRLCNLRK